MEESFWHERWENNQIGFHLSHANPLLVKHFESLKLEKGKTVFVPLCGKTVDIHWLLSKGYKIKGAELSEIAIKQLFEALKIKPEVKKLENLISYSAENITIFVGNIFDISDEILGNIDAIYDRAALVALPDTIREKYTKHLIKITKKVPMLLINFEYDQSLIDGPPFSISQEKTNEYYQANYNLKLLQSSDMVDGLKGKCPAKENVWLIN